MGSKILLADDSITIQKVVNLTFADEGIDVVTVSNGEMAERRLAEINPDLVLADIFMPGRNGYELCQYVKESPQFRNTPVVLLVGAFEPFDQAEAKRVRADAHLTKPFESRTLVDTVRRLIQSRPRTGPLHSGPLQAAGVVKETRRLDEQSELQQTVSPFDSIAAFAAPSHAELSGYASGSPSFPLGEDVPPPSQQSESQPEPFSVGYNPMWQSPETGAEHNTQELPTISIDLGESVGLGETPAQPPAAEFLPSTLTAEADAEPSAQEQGFSFSVVEPSAESRPVEHPLEPIPFEPMVAAPLEGVQASQQEASKEDFVPEVPPAEEASGFAVPSLFGDTPQNAIIDFDVVGQEKVAAAEGLPVPPPIAATDSAPVAFEVDFGDALPLPPNLEQRIAAHTEQNTATAVAEEPRAEIPEWSASQEEAPAPVSFAPDSATAFEITGLETQEPKKAEPEPVKTSAYLAEEEPLGDFLAEDSVQPLSAVSSASLPVEEAAPVNFAVSDSSESAESGFSVDLSEAPLESVGQESLPVHGIGGKTSPQASRDTGELEETRAESTSTVQVDTAAAESETGFAFAESEKQAISFQPVSVEPERVAQPITSTTERELEQEAEPELPDRFTSSGMWAADAKFSPIEIEAGPASGLTETPSEPAPHTTEAVPDLAQELEPVSFEPPQPAVSFEPQQPVVSLEPQQAAVSFEPAQPAVSLEPPHPAIDESGFAIVPPVLAKPEVIGASHAGTNGDAAAAGLSSEAINEIVKRVIAELSDSVVREIAWEVVPDCVERVIEKLSRESLSKRA